MTREEFDEAVEEFGRLHAAIALGNKDVLESWIATYRDLLKYRKDLEFSDIPDQISTDDYLIEITRDIVPVIAAQENGDDILISLAELMCANIETDRIRIAFVGAYCHSDNPNLQVLAAITAAATTDIMPYEPPSAFAKDILRALGIDET